MFPLINDDPDLSTKHELMKIIDTHVERHGYLGKEECRTWFFALVKEVYDNFEKLRSKPDLKDVSSNYH
jgi:hypothetical protein